MKTILYFTIMFVVIVVSIVIIVGVKRSIRWLFSVDEILKKLEEIRRDVE